MKTYLLTILLVLVFAVSATPLLAGDTEVRYENIDGMRYKIIYSTTGDKLIINYFGHGGIPTGKWELEGVEIFKDGRKIKDTFRENNR